MENTKIELMLESGSYLTNSTTKYSKRKSYEKKDNNKIVSNIPGTIVKLFVKEGDSLSEESPILVLEAMKMENIIRMPRTAVVKKILVSEKERIRKNTTMIILE